MEICPAVTGMPSFAEITVCYVTPKEMNTSNYFSLTLIVLYISAH